MFIRHYRAAPLVHDMQVVSGLAALDRASIVTITAAHQITLIRCKRFDRQRVLIDSLPRSMVMSISRRPRHPIASPGEVRRDYQDDHTAE